jgi:branched-chain amino acid transport system permease protein
VSHVTHVAGRGGPARALAGALALLLVAVAFVVGLAAPAGAQEEPAERIRGTLRTIGEDGEDLNVEGAEIVVTTPDGQEIGTATSDAEGVYELELPGPGEYVAELDVASLPEGVELAEGAPNPLEFQIRTNQSRPLIFRFAGAEEARASAGGGGGGELDRALQRLVDGIELGLIIAMAAVGLSLIFGTTGLTNFAHGEIVTFGAIAAWYVNVNLGIHFLPATVIAVVIGGVAGAIQDRLIWRPLRNRGSGLIAMLVISIGLSLLFRYVFLYQFGGRTRPYAQYAVQRAWQVGPVDIAPKTFYSIVISLVVLFLVGLGLGRTRTGKAMRAVADNGDLASASGIDTQRVILMVWVFGGALAALGGVLQGLNQQVSWQVGFQLLLLMFAGVTLGGLGTAYGALVGSLVVGIFISVSTIWIADELKNVGALLILIVVLLVRPQGILGRAERVG